jgi:hypothetical protein
MVTDVMGGQVGERDGGGGGGRGDENEIERERESREKDASEREQEMERKGERGRASVLGMQNWKLKSKLFTRRPPK